MAKKGVYNINTKYHYKVLLFLLYWFHL